MSDDLLAAIARVEAKSWGWSVEGPHTNIGPYRAFVVRTGRPAACADAGTPGEALGEALAMAHREAGRTP